MSEPPLYGEKVPTETVRKLAEAAHYVPGLPQPRRQPDQSKIRPMYPKIARIIKKLTGDYKK
jgi:hypothetical protein